MVGFAQARRTMVDGQVRTSDVTDLRLLQAMLDVPRERFVNPAQAAVAYLDQDIAIMAGAGGHSPRYLLKPMVLAKLIQAAEIGASDHVLDVGCASGYSAALLARLADRVLALEESPILAEAAAKVLHDLQAGNVTVVTAVLADGWPASAPYDVILLEGASEIVPRKLFPQLKDGGRLLCVHGRGPVKKAMLYRSAGGEVSGRPIFDAAAAVLPGFVEPPIFVF